MSWLRNSWYQAGWSEEIQVGHPLTRRILNEPILFYRTHADKVAALIDRCPHRFVPLSAGTFDDNLVTCPYHGLAFGPDGKCARNPHGPVTSSMAARSFPVEERHTAVWVWMGDAELADPDKIPDLSYIDAVPETARIRMHIAARTNYQLMTDNIMDLSHADYVHPNSLGGMMTEAKMRSREEGDAVIVDWTAKACTLTPAFAPVFPLDQKADFWVEVTWRPPGIMVLLNSVVAVGEAHKPQTQALHNMVPETETTTHYFMCATRSFEQESVEVTEAIRASANQAFIEEDRPMLELQQQSLGTRDFWEMKPILLPVDAAGVRARRKLDALIAAENVGSTMPAPAVRLA